MLVTAESSAAGRTTLTRTVAKEYVHRAALAEVFLTGWTKVRPDSFKVDAQWPRSHSFYGCENGLHDPLLLCETVRQTFPLLTHAAYDVPFGYQLSWSRFQYAVNFDAMEVKFQPAEMELHVTCSDIRFYRSLPASMSMHIEVVRGGELLAVVSTHFGCHSPAVYKRLRAGRAGIAAAFANAPEPPQPVARTEVNRHRLQDIVLSPTEQARRWQLRVDTGHPVLFDHAVDHVPGMLLLESVRQAGHAMHPASSGMMPAAMDVTFKRYVEFDEPCWIEAEPVADTAPAQSGRRTIRVNALQGEDFAFTATTEMADVISL
ncbi:ScbA/BarX family gamma-butyrolactone biosynthesis protein [Streptomyces sp. NPDC013178]|uniref:ScbA/BarX family gamma-butyrolactone biosynthesis protein n=1 Tax=unclassified Streptomyces TaxID=2593676 RepID=UPI00340A60C2